MGRQYGRLLTGEIRRLNRDVRAAYDAYDIRLAGLSLREFSRRSFALYPARFKSFARGVSEGAGVRLDVVTENTEFFEYFAMWAGPDGASPVIAPAATDGAMPAATSAAPARSMTGACSAITAWGAYTRNGEVVMGRDYDFPNFYRAFDRYLAVVVLRPTDGSARTALITWAGSVGAISGFNDRGLVLENNDGSSYGDPDRHFLERVPFMVQLPLVLLDHKRAAGVDAAMHSYRGPYPLIWNFASPLGGHVYETTTHDVVRRDGPDGLVVGVNHFTDPSWPELPTRNPDAIAYSEFRQTNLETLAEAGKGEIGPARMRAIMDTLLDDGGATPADENIYRFVAVPHTLQWWIRVPEHVGWVHADLAKLFRASAPRLTELTPR